jgi:hypothetical protein
MNIVSPAGKEGLQRTVSMNLKPPSKIDLHRSSDENDRMNKSVATKTTNLSSIRATVYTVADLQVATESFSADSLIGEGAFGRVYRGQFSDQKVYSSLCQNEKHTYFLAWRVGKAQIYIYLHRRRGYVQLIPQT